MKATFTLPKAVFSVPGGIIRNVETAFSFLAMAVGA